MAKINLPKEILKSEAFKTLPSKEKEEYMSNLLLKILQLNPEGVTISQIKEATSLTYSTIWRHLELLSCTAQSHKVAHGNLDVYYTAGAAIQLNEFDKGKIKYGISTVGNKEGKYVFIHEKMENRLGNYVVCRGVHIPLDLIDDSVKTIKKVK